MKHSKKRKEKDSPLEKLTNNKSELESLEQFFKLTQEQLMRAMRQYLSSRYNKIIANKKYLIAVGDIPIALVAHLDTVFKCPPTNIFYDREKCVMWSPEGLGADDRAGVYSIVQIIKAGYRPTVVFTTDEELGCIGAGKLVSKVWDAPTDLKYIIQLDRRDYNDCVFYSCDNPKFEEYIESFGFVTNYGSFSDISTICPAWMIAGVNLSIGYYGEHDFTELLCVKHMFSTIEKVKRMLDDADNAEHFEYIESRISKYDRWFSRDCMSKDEWDDFMNPRGSCSVCKEVDYEYNLFPIAKNGKTVFYCTDCLIKETNIHWCSICGEPFYDSSIDENEEYAVCEKCRSVVNAKTN